MVELILSDNVVKHEFAGSYNLWEASLAGANTEFKPFNSLVVEDHLALKASFLEAQVPSLNQEQLKNENWQVFGVSGEESNVESIESFGDSEQHLLKVLPQDKALDPQGVEQGYQEGYDKGFSLGQSEGKSSATMLCEQEFQALKEQHNHHMEEALESLSKVTDTLSNALLAPMQSVVMHLAKEVVRGELSVSSNAIERLITLSMEQLHTTRSSIQVYMNPLEFERLQHQNTLPKEVNLHPSNDVSMGSIKVEHAGSWVEDLLQDRLAQISEEAFGFVDKKFLAPMEAIEFEAQPEINLVNKTVTKGDLNPELKSVIEDE